MDAINQFKAFLAEKLNVHVTSNNKSRKKVIKSNDTTNTQSNTEYNAPVTINNNTYTFNLGGASKDEKAEMLAVLKQGFKDGDVVFIGDEQKRLVDTVERSEAENDPEGVVEFFKDKLSSIDWQILRSGIYISYLVEKGMPTQHVRSGIIASHGTRGKNLLNLASSGHFATHIKPLYEELSQDPDFTRDTFDAEFEIILKEMPFAIFVNSASSPQSIADDIKIRQEKARDYSVDKRKVFIHGWGSNVKTIEDALELLDKSMKVYVKKRREIIEIIEVTVEL